MSNRAGIIYHTLPAGFVAFIVLLALKLGGAVNWSWWFITIPLWGGSAIVLACVAAAFLFAFLCVLAGLFLSAVIAAVAFIKQLMPVKKAKEE